MKPAGETSAGAITRHENKINAHFQPMMGSLKSGNYVADLPFAGYGTFSTQTDNMFAGLFVASCDMRLDKLGVYIEAPSEGTSIRLGVYDSRDDFYPGELILDAGVVDASVKGLGQITINLDLEQGYYYLVCLLEKNCTLRYLKLAQSPLGMYSTFNAIFSGFACEHDWGELPLEFPDGSFATNVTKMVIGAVA